MSLDALRDEIAGRDGAAYLLTVGSDGRPHTVSVTVSWAEGELVVAPGNRSTRNATDRPLVSLLWPPAVRGGFSLIVDATVTSVTGSGSGDNRVVVTPTGAVLHRPADPGAPGAPASDCAPVYARPDEISS